jgi:hypothetical protein
MKDKPRIAVFKGIRHPEDLTHHPVISNYEK